MSTLVAECCGIGSVAATKDPLISTEDYTHPQWGDFVRGDIIEIDGRSELFEFYSYNSLRERLSLFDEYGMVRYFPTSRVVGRAESKAAAEWKDRKLKRWEKREAEPVWPGVVSYYGRGLAVILLANVVIGTVGLVVAYVVGTVLGWILGLLPGVLVFGWFLYVGVQAWRDD